MVHVSVKSIFDDVPFTPAAISGSIKEFTENHVALDRQMEELAIKYPNQWAGMSTSGLYIEPTFDALLSKMKGETNAAVRYLKRSPEHNVTYMVSVVPDRRHCH